MAVIRWKGGMEERARDSEETEEENGIETDEKINRQIERYTDRDKEREGGRMGKRRRTLTEKKKNILLDK